MGDDYYLSDDQVPSDKALASARRLHGDGFDAIINHYVIILVEPLLRWMLWRTERADFVYIVCTAGNLLRVNGEETSGNRHGVLWEPRSSATYYAPAALSMRHLCRFPLLHSTPRSLKRYEE